MKPYFAARRRPRTQPQLQLALPAVPKESPLRAAFRRAELNRVGLDFRAVHGHAKGAALLRNMAAAYSNGNEQAAGIFAHAIIGMRRELRRAP